MFNLMSERSSPVVFSLSHLSTIWVRSRSRHKISLSHLVVYWILFLSFFLTRKAEWAGQKVTCSYFKCLIWRSGNMSRHVPWTSPTTLTGCIVTFLDLNMDYNLFIYLSGFSFSTIQKFKSLQRFFFLFFIFFFHMAAKQAARRTKANC